MAKTSKKLCRKFNITTGKWEWVECYNYYGRGKRIIPPISPCCIPDECCFDCNKFYYFSRCFEKMNQFFTPDLLANLRTFDDWVQVSDLLTIVDCRFNVVPSGEILTFVVDTIENETLDCYTNISILNRNLQLPQHQCILFSGGTQNNCPDLGLCWYWNVEDLGGGLFMPVIENVKICQNPETLVDFDTFYQCTQCAGNIINQDLCLVQLLDWNQDKVQMTRHDTMAIYFDLNLPECCDNPGNITFEVDNFIFGAFTCDFLPLQPGANCLNINAFGYMGPPGNFNFNVVIKTENCGIVNLPIVLEII